MSTPDQREGKHFGVTRELSNQYAGEQSFDISPEARARIQARVAELMPALGDWQRRFFPVIAAARLAAVAQAIVTPCPDATFEEHLPLAKQGLLNFALDDVADGEIGSLDDPAIHQAFERYVMTAKSVDAFDWAGSDVASLLGSAIQEVSRDLHRAPGAARFLGLWQEHFQRFAVAQQDELRDKRRYQADGTLPSLEQYLRVAEWSVGAPMYFCAVLVVLAPPYEQDPLQDPWIERALEELALLVRWLNDVRSVERERSEGKCNGLTLLMAAGNSEAEAEREAISRADRHMESLQQAVRQLPPALHAWGGMLVTTGHLTRKTYMRGEVHHEQSGAAKLSG